MSVPLLEARPIDEASYAPYGQIVRAGAADRARSANHGTARAWDALATMDNLRPAAALAGSLFRCAPLAEATLAVRRLERHPASTQMFVPMQRSRYLVVVALGGDRPDLTTLAAFVVEGSTAITYGPGVWHHPMVALDDEIDFVNLIYADGSEGDCHEIAFEADVAQVRFARGPGTV